MRDNIMQALRFFAVNSLMVLGVSVALDYVFFADRFTSFEWVKDIPTLIAAVGVLSLFKFWQLSRESRRVSPE